MTARDTRMVEKALRQRWDIPDAARKKLPDVLAGIIGREDASDRNRIAAARALIEADKANLAAEGGGPPTGGRSITVVEVRLTESRPAPVTVDAVTAGPQIQVVDAGPHHR
jgi:hypothetical protein